MGFRRIIFVSILTASLFVFPKSWALAQESFQLIPNARFLLGMESHYIWLSGDTLIPAGGRPGSGTRVNVPDVLGVDQGEGTAIVFQATIVESHRLDADYLLFSPTAVKKINRDFVFHGQTYLAGTSLETRVDFNWARAIYGYKALDVSSWQLFPRVGVHYIRCTQVLNGQSKEGGVTSNSRSLDGTYPVIGFQLQYGLPYGFDLGLEAEGIHLITRGYLSLTSLKAQWSIHPDIVFSIAGYNRLAHYVEDNQRLNNEWFYSLSGWSAGISFSF